jgi:hypothetical protein
MLRMTNPEATPRSRYYFLSLGPFPSSSGLAVAAGWPFGVALFPTLPFAPFPADGEGLCPVSLTGGGVTIGEGGVARGGGGMGARF